MSEPHDTPQPPADANPRRNLEYDDPHYHDDDELPSDDAGPRRRPPAGRKPSGRIPPPRRPRYDD